MGHLPQHTIETAPDESKPILENTAENLGFIPNLYGKLAGAPAALEAYTTLGHIFDTTSLNVVERDVVLLSISIENGCDYCVAAHSVIARHMHKLDSAIVDALRERKPLPDQRLDALAAFTRTVVWTRGNPGDEGISSFTKAGFTPAQILEVLVGVAMKTLSNYTNHIANTELDVQFVDEMWGKPQKEATA